VGRAAEKTFPVNILGPVGLAPDHPFQAALPLGRSGVTHGPAGISVALRNDIAQIAVTARRGRSAVLAELFQARYGLAVPTGPLHVAAGPAALVGIGPGRWVFLHDAEDSTALAATLAAELGAEAAVADLSDSRSVLRLWGPQLRAVLAKGLPIDLHPSRFGPGDAATSVIALINVLLWQLDERPCFEIAVPRSLVGSFAAWLGASASEFGMDVVGADRIRSSPRA
jgi:methylglutamate dehydrogenase subunit D